MLVMVTNPEPTGDRPTVVRNEVFRRVAGSSAWDLLGEVVPNGALRDYTAASGVTYEYRARGHDE
jgi:hypothetical protein